jgi:hypothetical protein
VPIMLRSDGPTPDGAAAELTPTPARRLHAIAGELCCSRPLHCQVRSFDSSLIGRPDRASLSRPAPTASSTSADAVAQPVYGHDLALRSPPG